jgi:DNA repair protein RadB
MDSNGKISAGSYDLNKFLFGGYERDVITMLAGNSGSGKTNFCMLVAASRAKKGEKVLYMDSEGGFSSDRIKQLAGDKYDYKELLERILVLKPTNFSEQKKDFGKLLGYVRSGKIGLVVIDGMTMLYRLEIADAKNEDGEIDVGKIKIANHELARQMRILAEIARKQNIPVIVTNQVYSDFLTEEEMKKGERKRFNYVAGDLLKYWSKCIIELEYSKGRRTAILRKHRNLPEQEISFKITDQTIKKGGWI